MSFSLLFVVCCSLLSIDYYLALKWIGWVVSFAGIRRLCAWVRSNIVRRRVDWSGMACYKHLTERGGVSGLHELATEIPSETVVLKLTHDAMGWPLSCSARLPPITYSVVLTLSLIGTGPLAVILLPAFLPVCGW